MNNTETVELPANFAEMSPESVLENNQEFKIFKNYM